MNSKLPPPPARFESPFDGEEYVLVWEPVFRNSVLSHLMLRDWTGKVIQTRKPDIFELENTEEVVLFYKGWKRHKDRLRYQRKYHSDPKRFRAYRRRGYQKLAKNQAYVASKNAKGRLRYAQNKDVILSKQRAYYAARGSGLARIRRSVPKGRSYHLWRGAKHRATKNNLPFSIKRLDVQQALEVGVCQVTGIPFDYTSGSPWAPSLDKIVPSLGYTKDNTRCVVFMFNVAKHDFSDSDVMKMCKAVVASELS